MATANSVPAESQIFARMIAADEPFSRTLARSVLAWKFPKKDLLRIRRLQNKIDKGTITEPERAELGTYIRVSQFVAVLQAKASLSLKQRRAQA